MNERIEELQVEQEPRENNDWKKVSYIRETLNAEQVEQEPLMITPGGGAFPFAVVGEIEPAEQEPVAYQEKMSGVLRYGKINDSDTPLYAAPVRTKDLTDDEIHKCDRATVTRQDFARAVIAAFKEKNK